MKTPRDYSQFTPAFMVEQRRVWAKRFGDAESDAARHRASEWVVGFTLELDRRAAAAKSFQVMSPLTITDKRVSDLLCCAFEGGSNYWYGINGYEGDTEGVEFKHLQMPFRDGGAVIVNVPEDTDNKTYRLDRAACHRGLELMAARHPKHFADFLSENDDANTGDVFLQLALFGEVVYG